MKRKALFVYNPRSGEMPVGDLLDEITQLYPQKGYSLTLPRLTFAEEAGHPLDVLDNSYDHILFAGGDGSVNYIINELKSRGTDVPLAILPAGTANDFANALGMPTNILDGVKAILDGEERSVDSGKVNGTYFANVFSCGLFTDI